MTSDFYHSSLALPIGSLSANKNKKPQPPLSHQIISAFQMLLNLGTEFVTDDKQVKYIKICNFTAMTSFAASLVYIALSVLWSHALWFMTVNSLCIASVGVLFLNRTGHVNFSRIFYLVAVDTLLFISPLILGPHTHGENFLIIAVLIPFLMYDIYDFKHIVIGVTIPVVFILIYPYLEPSFTAYHLSLERQQILSQLGVPMEVGLGIAAMFQFAYYSRKTELELEASNHQMTLQTNELKRSNSDLEQFAYVISHDLKTPVRNISCFMQLLSNKHSAALDAEAKEFVNFAVTGSKRMERLIDDVLAYSRIGRNLSTPTPVNVTDVINTIRYELETRNDAPEARIEISGNMPIVNSAHSSLLYHIFQNLIRNGVKFNTSGHPEIAIGCHETDQFYMFYVSDNGIGISKKYSAQVFQMFKRLHTDNEYDGTGIGLAICKKIVELYHGEIWYESDESTGTTFYFTIRKF